MDDAVVAEREPPGAEHGLRDGVAIFERRRLVVEQRAALEPGHGEQPLGRQLGQDLRHADALLVGEDAGIEPGVARLQLVVELLAQPRRNLLEDLARLDRRVHARVNGEHGPELHEVGFDRRGHVRVLQLDGERASVVRRRAVHLAERSGRGGGRIEGGKARRPIGAELRLHAALGERRPHRRAPPTAAAPARCAYSAGSASGMVESSCATFISGPLRPPSAAARSAAPRARSCSTPNRRSPATRAATAPTLAPTFT